MTNTIILTIVILSGLGLLLALVLFFVAKKFKVEEDPRIDDVEKAMPGANCGGCGFAGCRAFAEAAVKAGNLDNNFCPVGGNEVMKQVASILGYEIKELPACRNYHEYLEMGESFLNLTLIPNAFQSGHILSQRLKTVHIHIPCCYGYDEIEENYRRLFSFLKTEMPDFENERIRCENALANALKVIGKTAVSIDYTAVFRPLGLARLLAQHGFNVTEIICDVFSQEEKEDFEFLQHNFPDIEIRCSVKPEMRFYHNESCEKILCIGQKSAWYNSSDYFVNIVSGGGFYGFRGIEKICSLMTEAFLVPKDRRKEISRKGLGCESCL